MINGNRFDRKQPRIQAIVTTLGDKEEKARWRIGERSLLSAFIEKIRSEPRVKQIVIVSDGFSNSRITDISGEIDVLKIPVDRPLKGYSSSRAEAIAGKVHDHYQKLKGKATEFDGIMIVDPFCQIEGRVYIEHAINIYLSQAEGPRPWPNVVSVTGLPNHFHPKKIITVSEDGSLKYFDKKGSSVYRRQQLDDAYYTVSGAVSILDPKMFDKPYIKNNIMLGCVIDGAIVNIQERHDIDLLSALNHDSNAVTE
ncbi:MAG: hypothetical protein JW882_02470 [Deltaproteobacteria bacterium]|nr:hypothetical protein [Deltaproteobacteria bacterium]